MGFFKKGELGLLWPFYLDAILTSIFYIFPAFYVIYFKEIGLSLFQIGLLISSTALARVLFEVPTGAVADIFGRKFSSILGYSLSGIFSISVMFFKDFYSLIFLYFVMGAGWTFVSGACDAWVVDLLKHKKRKELIQDYFSKNHSFVSFGCLFAGVVGALLVKKYGLGIIWPVTGGAMILTAIIFLFGQEYFTRKKQGIKEHTKEFFSHTKKSLKFSIKHKGILLMLIATAIFAIIGGFAGDITWYPFLQGLGFKDYWFGYLFSAGFALGVFIPYFIKPLATKIGYRKYLAIITSLIVLFLLSVIFAKTLILAVILYILYISMYDFFHPARVTLLQRFIPSKMRATINSLDSMSYSLIAIISFPLAGFVADKISPQYTIVLGAFILIPAVIIYLKVKE